MKLNTFQQLLTNHESKYPDHTIEKTTYTIAGLAFHVYRLIPKPSFDLKVPSSTLIPIPRNVFLLFCLHWRSGSADAIDPVARCFTYLSFTHPLWVITLDLRNHGTRLINDQANLDWKSGNPNHAFDMYSIQCGSCQDISLIMDYFPCLFPDLFPSSSSSSSTSVSIQWGVFGISLGAHIALQCMGLDSRFQFCVSMLGSADYTRLMHYRFEHFLSSTTPSSSSSSFFTPPLTSSTLSFSDSFSTLHPYWSSLQHLITNHDPIFHVASFLLPIKKHTVLLYGEKDTLVPFHECNSTFLTLLHQHHHQQQQQLQHHQEQQPPLPPTLCLNSFRSNVPSFSVESDPLAKHECSEVLTFKALHYVEQWLKNENT